MEITELQNKLTTFDTEVATGIHQAITLANSTISNLSATIEELTASKIELEAEISLNISNYEEQVKLNDSNSSIIKELQAQVKEADTKADNLESALADARAMIKRVQDETIMLNNTIAQNEASIKGLALSLQEAQRDIVKEKELSAELQKELKDKSAMTLAAPLQHRQSDSNIITRAEISPLKF